MRYFVSLIPWLFGAVTLSAHFHVVVPENYSARKDEPTTFRIQWGHPYEAQWFDTQRPEAVTLRTPSGKLVDLTAKLEKQSASVPNEKPKTAYRVSYTPKERGDHVLVVRTPPVWLEEEESFLQDNIKVILHVQAQNGWDVNIERDSEWVPLTRPYGLRAGSVFRAMLEYKKQVLRLASSDPPVYVQQTIYKPLDGARIEIEQLNETPPKELPPDEFITLMAKTDPRGIVTASLPDPGWWSLTSSREDGKREHQGKMYPLRRRSTLWVYVHPNEHRP